MQQPQTNKPQKLNLDKSKKYLSEDEMFYALNHDILNPNALSKSTPHSANEALCEVEQPAGENYANGSHYSQIANEAYSWHLNSQGANYIMRVNGHGKCDIVYDNDVNGCLQLSANPKHSIEDWRSFLHVEKICANRDGKYLIWTDGLHDIGYLDVEASIATDSFTTPFFKTCVEDPCDFIRLCVPKPCGCLNAEFIPLPEADIALTNQIVDTGFKFMYQFEYYDGRKSDWSDPSTLYYQDSKGCFDTAQGFPRCIKLTVPVGNPMVDKIHIAFNKGGIDEAGNNVWYRTEIVEKYEKYTNSQEKWYNRQISKSLLNFSAEKCTFDYIFCNDKQCEVVDPVEVNRVYNPIPREAQGLLPIKDGIGVYNYKGGTCPIDKKEVEKFSVELDCSNESECKTEYAYVTVRAVIHNFTHDRNQFIWREKAGSEDDLTDKAKFGGLNKDLDGGIQEPMGHDQYFEDKVRNFIAYVEGEEYWGEMKQHHSEAFFNNVKLHGVVGGMEDNSVRRRWRRDARHGGFFYQEFKFKFPKGKRGFIRLASHKATNNEQSSSTFVIGVHKNLKSYKGDGISGEVDYMRKEIYFDTCNGDVETTEAFVIEDHAVDKGGAGNRRGSSFYGYIRDEAGIGLEGLCVAPSLPFGIGEELNFCRCTTDHNGFYHFVLESGTNDDVSFSIKGELDCGRNFDEIKKGSVAGEVGTGISADFTITEESQADYLKKHFATVKMRVNDCDGRGIGGIRVALSGSKWRHTDAHGIVKFKVRNYITRARNVRAVVLDYNGCFSLGCDNSCNPCMPTATGMTPSCYESTEVDLGAVILNKDAAVENSKGLKRGGKYPYGIVAKGRCGRISAVYELPAIEIPRLQKNDTQSVCGFKYNSLPDMTFPDWVTCVDIVRGTNLNPFELQWLIDKIEKTSDGKLKLTIQSLNDYNESYFFKTNTNYNWLKGDRVEFIKNGDGRTLMSSKHGLLNYLTLSPAFDKKQTDDPDKEQPANFFNQLLIDDDGRLDDLKEGALIEIQRSKECVTQPVYYGICVSIPVEDGKLVYSSGKFQTFDTYLVKRKVGKFPTQPFEHHAPSDFWGERVDDTGRGYFVNKYENEKRFGRSISISSPTQINYFGDIIKTFDAPDMGDIIALKISDGKIILAICEHDNFLAQSSDELVRVGSDGVIRAVPADSIISEPQPHLQGVYGCQYPDIGSILFGDGFATWVDSNRSTFVHHQNYQVATDVSDGKMQSYFKIRCNEVINHNKNEDDYYNHFRYSTGINKYTGAVYITIKRLRDNAVNNQPAPYLQPNETLLYYPPTKDWLTFLSLTAESYTQLHLHDKTGCAMVSYFNGVPYLHPINATKWNEFCGAACDRYVGIVINKFPEKEKIAVALEIEDEMMWYAKKIETDKPNYESEIPAVNFKKSGRKWNSRFLGNKNSRVGLFGDEKPRGYYIAITFCRDNTDGLKYNTIDRNLQIKYDELDQILSKFMLSEQSGFTENL